MPLEEGVEIAGADPPALADIDGTKLAVFYPAPNGDLADFQKVSDLLDGLVLLAGHAERLFTLFGMR